MKYFEDQYNEVLNPSSTTEQEFGCGFCWDKKKKKEKELFFLDAANNMRPCLFCPYCGRNISGG